jgi:CubicO group peptidase (beta-lactamase class C family)
MRVNLLTILAMGAVAASASAQQTQNPQLEGLWVARQIYGPEVDGTLIIRPQVAGLVADIAGFIVPVMQDGRRLSFELPGGRGNFRGIRNGATIDGQWIQSQTTEAGARYSTPIILRTDRRGRWRGEVKPRDDQMTYYLPVTRGADGRYSIFLRNPERNQGVFLGVSRIEREGDSVRLVGTRRGQKQESVISTGSFYPEATAFSLPIFGNTFDFRRDLRASSDFYPRGNPAVRYSYRPPIALDDGWPVSTLDKEDIDRASIEKFVQFLIDLPMDSMGAHQVHSVLVARNGKLVLEEYFHGAHRDEPHDLRSASKSWTSMLIGAAMQSGVPIRLDTPLYQTMLGAVPAELDPRKKQVTLEHLLTMTAGFDCDDSGDRPGDEDVFQQQSAEPNWYRYMLNVPMAWSSGDKIVYCSGKPNLAAGMLEKVAGEPLPEMFERLIGRPLQMSRYHLFLQPTGEAYGGGGHRFTSRDFAKWPQLMINDGKWRNRQIFSRQWAQQSSAPLRLLSPRSGQTYGYLWNSVVYDYKDRKLHAFFAGGNGGQISMGIPELGLVIVFTGGSYADPALFLAQRKYVPEFILPAVN